MDLTNPNRPCDQRGYETESSKLLMRNAVLVSDLLTLHIGAFMAAHAGVQICTSALPYRSIFDPAEATTTGPEPITPPDKNTSL